MNGLPELMLPGEVAEALRVDPKTVTRWAKAGMIRHTRTPGTTGWGHIRLYRGEIAALAAGKPLTGAQLDALVNGDPS